jgi:hypothetical protein
MVVRNPMTMPMIALRLIAGISGVLIILLAVCIGISVIT